MFEAIGAPELLIILIIVALLFGVGRVSSLGKELGTAVNEFRKGLKTDAPTEQAAESANKPQ
jgi:sec-independent protein translocase protein TatA